MIRKIRYKMFFFIIILLMIVILSMSISFAQLFKTIFTSNRLEDLQHQAYAYSNSIDRSNLQPLYSLKLQAGQSIVLVDKTNKIRYQQGTNITNYLISRIPGENQVLQGQVLVLKTSLPTFLEPTFLAGVPVGSPPKGALFLFEKAASGDNVMHTIDKLLGLSIFGAILLAIGVLILFINRMIDPLLQIEETVIGLIRGDYTKKLNIQTKNEFKSLGDTFNELIDHLQRQKTTRAEFLSNISHEIRTPISYIQGYTQILDENLVDTAEERQQYIGIIHEELKRLRKFLDDLLDLAKFEEVSFKIEVKPQDLVPIIRKVMQNLEPLAKQKKISLGYEGEAKLPAALVDADRIEQLLINLIHNAIRYSNENNNVIIRSKYSDMQIYVAVEDHGPGIPAKDLPHIWGRFQRGEKSRNRMLGGAGLGLSIAKQIAEAHQGRIQAWSELGKGTTISFVLPRKY